jgi:hypothetical protein
VRVAFTYIQPALLPRSFVPFLDALQTTFKSAQPISRPTPLLVNRASAPPPRQPLKTARQDPRPIKEAVQLDRRPFSSSSSSSGSSPPPRKAAPSGPIT